MWFLSFQTAHFIHQACLRLSEQHKGRDWSSCRTSPCNLHSLRIPNPFHFESCGKIQKKMESLPKPICVFLSEFLDIKGIGRMTRVNKLWKEIMERDQVNQRTLSHIFILTKNTVRCGRRLLKNLILEFLMRGTINRGKNL